MKVLDARPVRSFPDEDHWPLLGRAGELDRCLAFLAPEDKTAPSRLLHVSGDSGAGKSFFVKELLCRFAQRAPASVALYVDIDESDFESAELEKRLAVLAAQSASPSRGDPQHIPAGADLARHLAPLPRWRRLLAFAYRAVRELSVALPLVGRILGALLPRELPPPRARALVRAGRCWEYLINMARRSPVLLVIDNVQFLPRSVLLEIDTVLAAADRGFRLTIVERVLPSTPTTTSLRCFRSHRLLQELRPISEDDTDVLVRSIVRAPDADIPSISAAVFRKSQGNPKQIWLQLRSLHLSRAGAPNPGEIGDYDETILGLPALDRLMLQLVTLLIGSLKCEDLIHLTQWFVHPLTHGDIERSLRDLATLGLLIINGSHHNRVRTEHELVRTSVRRLTSEEDALDLRHQVVEALVSRLERATGEEEYERLVDRLIGLLSAEDLRERHDLLGHLIALIDRQHSHERFHYLLSLYDTLGRTQALGILPSHSLTAFLDAFQKTSQFDRGLAAVEMMRGGGRISDRHLAIFAAKYLVQKFAYRDAEEILATISPGSDRDLVAFNILLVLARDDEARHMIDDLRSEPRELDEYRCVMFRNAGHLYPPDTAREVISRAEREFRRQGLRFGAATALNNLGAVELWANRYSVARRCFLDARSELASLGSNEVYQPATNLAVLHALEGDIAGAQAYQAEARRTVSPWLVMDDLMLRLNELAVDVVRGRATLPVAAAAATDLYRRSLSTRDIRFQRILSWFAAHLESAVSGEGCGDVVEGPDPPYLRGDTTGLEIYVDARVDERPVKVPFQLSTHWRY